MTFGSLFAGIGGFDLGLERAGMTCLWQCEIDKYANQILKKHWPEVKKYDDIKQLTKPESVDLICGGFPCQDVSMAGNRAGLAGERSGLFFEALRIIGEIKPKWIFIENVPGLLSIDKKRGVGTVVGGLAKLGYLLGYRMFDSQYFGVPQRRRRIYILGCLGKSDAIKILFEPLRKRTVLENKNNQKLWNLSWNKNGKKRWQSNVAATLLASEHSNIIEENGELRYLTPIECERLQGFPDGWTDILSDVQRYKTLGNAVTVNIIEWIGKRIKEAK